MLAELQRLHDWLDNREPLLVEFGVFVALAHKEPWPSFSVDGQQYEMKRGTVRPRCSGVPAGSHNAGGGEGPDRPVLVELASRVTAVRSRRWDTAKQKVKPIPKGWGALAREVFPFLCYSEHGPGWADLIIAMGGWIAEIGPEPDFRFSDLKEKYGTLRCYHYSADDRIEAIAYAAEWLSGCMCDMCGAPGKLRSGGWMSTRCDAHA